MGNKLSTPLETFETGVKAFGILWDAWQQMLAVIIRNIKKPSSNEL